VINDTTEVNPLATASYNRTIHSVTDKKPIDTFNTNRIQERNQRNKQQLQNRSLEKFNKVRTEKDYQVGDKVFLKSNKRFGNKLSPLCSEQTIEADMGTTVLIKEMVVH